jgi:hypothetical protein
VVEKSDGEPDRLVLEGDLVPPGSPHAVLWLVRGADAPCSGDFTDPAQEADPLVERAARLWQRLCGRALLESAWLESIERREPVAAAEEVVRRLERLRGVDLVRVVIAGRVVAERGVRERGDPVVVPFPGGVDGSLTCVCSADVTVWLEPIGAALGRSVQAARIHHERRLLVHDVRGALAVVCGQLEMLEAEVWGAVNPAQLKALRSATRQAERTRELLETLRDTWSRSPPRT